MPGPLKNAQREKMAQEMAKGSTDFDAYRAAGYKGGRPAACAIANLDEVKARVAELQARAAEKTIVTVADIARQLDEDREFARGQAHSAAAVSATMGKAKVLGLIVEKHEHKGELNITISPEDAAL